MEFSVKSGSPEKQRSACIVVGVFEPRRLSPIAEQLDKISDGYISALLRRGELEGKPGQTLLLHHVPNVLSERILLIGCGKERELDERQYKQVIQKTINTLNDTGSMEAVCFLTELHVKGRNTYWKVRQAVETAKESLYSFDQLKTNKSEPRRPLRKMVFNVPTRRELTSGERAIQHGLAIAAGIKAAKDLGNMPPNICNAAYLASQARQLADSNGCQGIVDVVAADDRHGNVERLAGAAAMEADALLVADDVVCPDSRLVIGPIEDGLPFAQSRHRADEGIVAVEDSRPLFIQGLDEFGFGLGDIFLRAEQFDMALADVGYDADSRFADGSQFGNLS